MNHVQLQFTGTGIRYFMLSVTLLLTDCAGNGPATKKKPRKKEKRKRCEEEEEEDVPSADNEDNRVEHFGVAHQQQRPKTNNSTPQQTGRLPLKYVL